MPGVVVAVPRGGKTWAWSSEERSYIPAERPFTPSCPASILAVLSGPRGSRLTSPRRGASEGRPTTDFMPNGERKPERSGKAPLRVLYVEDDPSDVELVKHELTKLGVEFILTHVATREAYVTALREFTPEIVLSDHGLPSFDSLAALSILRKETHEVPFILVSGILGEERAIEILTGGVTDYVLKNRLSRLVPAVRRACEEAAERAEHRRAEEALRESEERYTLAVRGAN